MSNNNLYENDSVWLKDKSQKNREQRFKQLEFDFGPSLEHSFQSKGDH